ncbi:hypothetical protein OGAPHI_005633 [Ogataea philodendri]|uniref:Histone-lysine N-methyltransferase, H3 lysine-36 specific n=1 Tax=Ogataea philodendri TaxID=1378263 RepID=A0A9P8NZZ6_9ASCO|nr:uncharacterized protein OGAPHI_005633 [Ogataea philodendri]KAH3662381.1 hypothetical protein OGAPHI_005633 [Ogataea philodendri]
MSKSRDNSSSITPPLENGNLVLYDTEPDATEEALSTFVNLKNNVYCDSIKDVYSAADEFMTCDCTEDIGSDGENHACGPDSDCINRLTNIECVDGQCQTCGDDCQNQRFQKNEIAPVSIFKTQHKGFGMRADKDIPAQTFIVEYKGEIVDNELYKENKEKYSNEGIKHFYFMMIQDNEIIDATKKASIGRFCNHSCDPNAFVEKWVVNKRFRMGIFAKRKILKGEEITFDYNVDRYGAEPQKCYCGAANCLGVMGGKTQSESARLLPHTISEALGVRANVEKKWIKDQKKNGIKVTQDNIDSNVNAEFVKSLILDPLTLGDVSKVVSCLLQPDLDFIVISRVIERFTLCENYDEIVERFCRLHGMQALSTAIKTVLKPTGSKLSIKEEELFSYIINILLHWPTLRARNSIANCKIDELLLEVRGKSNNQETKTQIDQLLNGWKDLELVYRIPKKSDLGDAANTSTNLDDRRTRSTSAPAAETPEPVNTKIDGVALPPGWEWAEDPSTKAIYYYNRTKNITQWEKPKQIAMPSKVTDEEERKRRREKERQKEEAKLKRLERERQMARQKELETEEKRMSMLSSIIAEASLERPASPVVKKETDHVSSVEKQWTKLFAAAVPNMMKKYQSEIGRDGLKTCARDVVHTLAQKEFKRHADETPPDELSEEKKAKVKHFVKEYMAKYLSKLEEKRKRKASQSSSESKRAKV